MSHQRASAFLALFLLLLLPVPVARADLTREQTKEAEALIKQFSAREFAVRQNAVEELVKMGPGVLPLVRKALAETKDAEVKLRCEIVIKRISEAQRKKSWNAAVARFEAMPNGVRQVRELLQMLGAQNFDARQKAVNRLIELGPGVLPIVEKYGKGATGEFKLSCDMVIKGIRKKYGVPVEEDHLPEGVKIPAGLAEGIKRMIPGLYSPDAAVRRQATLSLGDSADQRVVEFLIARLVDEDAAVRDAAGKALRNITGQFFAADHDRWRRWWQGVKHPREKVATLIARLSDPRDEVRWQAIMTLAELRDPSTVDALVERFVNREGGGPKGPEIYKDYGTYKRDLKRLKVALIMMGKPAVGKVLPVAGYGWGIRDDAEEVLVHIAKDAVPELIAALNGPNREAREGALKLVARFTPPEAVDLLIKIMGESRSSGERRRAYDALASYGKDMIPRFRKALADEMLKRRTRAELAALLARWGNRSGWPLLEEIVTQGGQREMNAIVNRMGSLKDPVFLPLIEKALERDDAWQGVTYAAAYCGGKDAIPMLKKALNHPNKGVRYGAKTWIEKLSENE